MLVTTQLKLIITNSRSLPLILSRLRPCFSKNRAISSPVSWPMFAKS